VNENRTERIAATFRIFLPSVYRIPLIAGLACWDC
jgi:hypothetical protein